MAIFYYYIEVLDAPHSIHWRGKGGIISIVRKSLHMMPYQRRVIKSALVEIMRCTTKVVAFDGTIESKIKQGEKSLSYQVLLGNFSLLIGWKAIVVFG